MKLPLQSRRASWGALAAAFCLVGALAYHVVCGQHGYLALRRERQEFRALQGTTDHLEQENASIRRSIDALKNDRQAVEKKAREDLLMAKPGEIIIRYSDRPSGDQANPKPGALPPQPAPSR